ncbi:MAG: hypothetical protein E7812_19460 [Phenylobacterium sp.]|nr:MAG: hypothetical protein E7812_19460 [Phenylobacterium sp.]
MRIHLERLRQPQLGVTLVDCPEVLLNLFQQERPYPPPPFSVLMVDGDIPIEGDLVLDASRLTAVTIGLPGFALLVGRSAKPLAANIDTPFDFEVELASEAEPPLPALGDLEFLAEADAKLKDEALRRDLRALVEQVRAMAPKGTLRGAKTGLGFTRRYVNVPDNFVGFTIRNQAVVVRARRSGVARMSKFKIAHEQRPFIRFQLRSPEDVVAALPLIEASWRRGA